MARAKRRKVIKAETDNRLFVSYSRADSAFVRSLLAALQTHHIGTWVDWEDIPPSAEWMAEIRRGIDAADAFAFVISPNSLSSQVCLEELEHALAAGKRLIPLLLKEGKKQQVPKELGKLNWILARTEEDLATAIKKLVEALTTDLDKLRMHARLLLRAREWTTWERDGSYLLRGRDLAAAEEWLASLGVEGPAPSKLHKEYMLASQQAEREEGARWRRLYEQSLARQLAAQSQLLVDQRGTALPLAALLAVEATRRSPSLETDQALRKTLSLLPLKHREITGRKFDNCFWADGADRVAVAAGKRIEVWTLDGGQILGAVETEGSIPERGLYESPVVLSWDGERVAAIAGETFVCVWSVSNGDLLLRHDLAAKPRSLALDRGANRLAVTGADATTTILDVEGGKVVSRIEHSEPMFNLTMHPGAKEFAAWGETYGEIWDLEKGTRIASIPHNNGAQFVLRYSPTGEYLALLHKMTYELNVFHVPTRKRIFEEKRHIDLAFEPHDRCFAIASPEWDIAVYKLPECSPMFRMRHDDSVYGVAFSPDGHRLSSDSKDGTVRVWEVEREGRELARIVTRGESVRRTVFSQDRLRLFLLKKESIGMHDAHGFHEQVLFDLPSSVFAVSASPSGEKVLFGCRNGWWAVVDYGKPAAKLIYQSRGRNAMGEQVTHAFFVDQTRVLFKRSVGLWELVDISSGKMEDAFSRLKASIAAASGIGAVVVAEEDGNKIVKWDEKVVAERMTDSPVEALAYAASGLAIAARCKDRTLIVYDGNLGQEIQRLAEPFGLWFQLSAGGEYLAMWNAGDDISAVRVVNTQTAQVLAEWTLPSRINDLRFDPHGERVVIALQDKSAQVWDIQSGSALAVFRHEAAAMRACFSAKKGTILSGGWDGAVRIWPWNPDSLIKIACSRLDRDLTQAEWKQYLPGEPYRATRALLAN